MAEAKQGVGELILGRLGSDRRQVRFVAELSDAVVSDKRASREEFEAELARLEASGSVLVRQQYCADPHLATTDLRLVALVTDKPEAAIEAIDAAWQEWLKGYLANHRCT